MRSLPHWDQSAEQSHASPAPSIQVCSSSCRNKPDELCLESFLERADGDSRCDKLNPRLWEQQKLHFSCHLPSRNRDKGQRAVCFHPLRACMRGEAYFLLLFVPKLEQTQRGRLRLMTKKTGWMGPDVNSLVKVWRAGRWGVGWEHREAVGGYFQSITKVELGCSGSSVLLTNDPPCRRGDIYSFQR